MSSVGQRMEQLAERVGAIEKSLEGPRRELREEFVSIVDTRTRELEVPPTGHFRTEIDLDDYILFTYGVGGLSRFDEITDNEAQRKWDLSGKIGQRFLLHLGYFGMQSTPEGYLFSGALMSEKPRYILERPDYNRSLNLQTKIEVDHIGGSTGINFQGGESRIIRAFVGDDESIMWGGSDSYYDLTKIRTATVDWATVSPEADHHSVNHVAAGDESISRLLGRLSNLDEFWYMPRPVRPNQDNAHAYALYDMMLRIEAKHFTENEALEAARVGVS